MRKQLTREEAIEFAERGEWKTWTATQIVDFQLFQDKMCMDFSVFHEAVETILCRPVFTHEFAFKCRLIDEYLGLSHAPTQEEIINLLPNAIVITLPDGTVEG